MFELPRKAGQYNGIDIICTKGRFGPYLKVGDMNVSLPKGTDPLTVTEARCIEIIEASLKKQTSSIIADFEESGIQVINGNYGPYIKYNGSNYRIPKGTDATSLTEEICRNIVANSEPTGKKRKK